MVLVSGPSLFLDSLSTSIDPEGVFGESFALADWSGLDAGAGSSAGSL